MKVQGTGLSKLFATKVEQKPAERASPAPKGDSAQAVETSIRGSVAKNLEAANAITRVAQTLPTSESGPARSAKRGEIADSEIARANQSSSESKVEDVGMFAEKLANRILSNPEQALQAQNNLANEKVENLLR